MTFEPTCCLILLLNAENSQWAETVHNIFCQHKNLHMKEMLYAVRCLKSNEDMILALAGQFKQLSHEPEKFRLLNGIRTHDLCDAGAVL